MRKVIVFIVAALVALAVCAPAMASSSAITWWHPPTSFTVAGKVQAVDTTNSRLVLRVQLASLSAKQYLGEDMTVVVAPDAQLLKAKGVGFVKIALADIAPDDHVRVMGTVDRSGVGGPTYTAERVIMRHLVPPEGIKFFAFRGRVVSVDAAGSKLVAHLHLVTRALWQALETDFGFTVGPKARIVQWVDGAPVVITLADVAAGDTVLAKGHIDRTDPANPVFIIHWMRVWKAAPTL